MRSAFVPMQLFMCKLLPPEHHACAVRRNGDRAIATEQPDRVLFGNRAVAFPGQRDGIPPGTSTSEEPVTFIPMHCIDHIIVDVGLDAITSNPDSLVHIIQSVMMDVQVTSPARTRSHHPALAVRSRGGRNGWISMFVGYEFPPKPRSGAFTRK